MPSSKPTREQLIRRRDEINEQLDRVNRVQRIELDRDPEEQANLYDPDDPRVLELWSLLRPQVEAMKELVVGDTPTPNWPDELP